MKRVSIAIVAAFAGLTAFGELSWAMLNTEQYGSDTSPSAATTDYTAYLCLASTAQSLFDTKEVAGVTDYLVNHFADGKLALAGNATALDAIEWGLGQYTFSTYFPPTGEGSLGAAEYLGIVLYSSGDGEEDAVRVFSADSDGVRWIADDSTSRPAGTAGDWAQAVPEPTSGLLVLCGCALMALKRKKA